MAAAAVVSVSMGVMQPVLAKLTTLMGDEYRKLKGLRKEVTFLQHELSDMDALLEKMDNADELDLQAKKWRRDIIEMSYNIEDHIDEFMHSVGEANDKMGILQKASHYVKTFKDRRRLAIEFQEIKTLVTEASDRRKRYMLDNCISVTAPVVIDPRMSTLYKESASLVGIKSQKDELVSWVMDEVKQLKFMAIVGFGGIGKTTLANEVYRDVGDKFDCKAFISVSQKPQMIVLFNSLLRQLGQQTYPHACQLKDLINDIRGHLQDKRYLLIIDDLWGMQAWDVIQCAFAKSNHSSRVIITTRNENVARSCCHDHGCIHNMKLLSEQDSRKLFFGRIFGSKDACPTELKKASYEILRKCSGLPLAIITMACMLACQPIRSEGQWDYMNNSLDNKSTTNSKYEDMMYILDLGYKNLPQHLKACFLYLGSYPEDHTIRRAELVRRWVAEGFVSKSLWQDVWDVADSYFNDLVNRSMIQPIYDDYTAAASGCRVHDMVLDLIMRRCKEDNFLHLINDPEAVVEVQDEVRIRRLTVVGLRDTEADMNVTRTNSQKLSQLRSLTILGESNWTPPLLEFKLLRMLFIGLSSRMTSLDLKSIVQLRQLKYLKVECNGWITGGPHHSIVLPNQIGMLQYLETLELPEKSSCQIPKDVVHLSRLSHLTLPLGTRLPEPIGMLKSLRTLDGFSLAKSSLQNTKGLSDLTNLADLKLIISREVYYSTILACAENDDTPEATWMVALRSSMGKLGNLKRLSMMSFYECSSGDSLSSFSPPFHNLEHLNLSGWYFSRVPKWVGVLRNLHSLELVVKEVMSESTCKEDVGIIGMLPSLVQLSLRIPGIPRERIVIGSTGFATLNHLRFDCDAISYLTFEEGAMPKLSKIVLAVDSHIWDKATPTGLEHLLSLTQIEVWWAKYLDISAKDETEERKISEQLIQRLFQLAVDALPSRPAFILHKGCTRRTRTRM